MIFTIDPTDPTGTSCREYEPDMCGVDSCFNSTYSRSCWQFNRETREWTNRLFTRKMVNGVCGLYDRDNSLISEDLYTSGFCKEFSNEPGNRPPYTKENVLEKTNR